MPAVAPPGAGCLLTLVHQFDGGEPILFEELVVDYLLMKRLDLPAIRCA